ncbi:MAG: hypothetical protein EA403_14245 [Spirochaetaceae bacterium]|nr:MAG: hypothetical protein EA403_14245 [Spirochaetaceae bacterium]
MPESAAPRIIIDMPPFFRSMARAITAAITLFVWTSACVTSPGAGSAVDDAIAARARFFNPQAVPSELVEALRPHRLVLLGESHYVQEHQDFVVLLLRELHPHGLRWFADELSHASGWAVDDFVRGLRDDPPPSVVRMNETYLNGLRAFNATLPPSERIRFRYIDMNHNPTAFQTSLQMMIRETDLSPVAAEIVEVLASDPYDEDYLEALHALERAIAPDRSTGAAVQAGASVVLRDRAADLWFHRLRETLEVEIRSFPLRLQWDVAERELIMIDLVNAILDESGNDMVAVNTGMFHAQRQRFMGTRQEWLGEYLVRNSQLTQGAEPGSQSGFYAIAFFGMRGERIRHSRDQQPQPMRPLAELPQRNLSRRIADAAASAAAGDEAIPAVFLPLDQKAFERRMLVSYGFSPVRAIPARQFDAFVVYPEVSVLRSLQATWYTAP